MPNIFLCSIAILELYLSLNFLAASLAPNEQLSQLDVTGETNLPAQVACQDRLAFGHFPIERSLSSIERAKYGLVSSVR